MEIFTSVPAKVSRRVNGDQEVGMVWTHACINSWINAGYDVVSVNSSAEAVLVRESFPQLRVHEVSRDGQSVKGRPLVYFQDMLTAMAASPHRSVAIANADVMFLKDAEDKLRNWEPDGFAFSNRLDIDDPTGRNPRLHGGVDFLIVNTRHIKALEVPDFFFGTPWWDYWLPMILMGKGAKGHKLSLGAYPVISHLAHEDRWKPLDFTENWSLFLKSLAQMIDDRAAHPAELGEINTQTGLPGALLQIGLEMAKSSSALIHSISPRIDLNE